ncbi:MAG: tRNA (adenosine(37)-N6)-dimethylallyltransferase MiaA [bacterium]
MDRPGIIVIMGPTAAGKSAVGMIVAGRLGAGIISADSRQVYRGMNIGTAKPGAADRARVPHHLIDVLTPDQPFSAGSFREMTLAAIEDIQKRGKRALVVGGTSLYLKALVGGYRLSDMPPDPEFRGEMRAREAERPGFLYRRLAEVNPVLAARLSPRDFPRLIRALEVARAPNGTPTRHSVRGDESASNPETRVFALLGSRDWVYDRINRRVNEMFTAGLVEEVRALLAKYPPDAPAFTTPGYREIIAYLHQSPVGDRRAVPASLEEVKELIKRNTRRFAKHQFTWLKQFDYTPVDIETLGVEGAAEFIVNRL